MLRGERRLGKGVRSVYGENRWGPSNGRTAASGISMSNCSPVCDCCGGGSLALGTAISGSLLIGLCMLSIGGIGVPASDISGAKL